MYKVVYNKNDGKVVFCRPTKNNSKFFYRKDKYNEVEVEEVPQIGKNQHLVYENGQVVVKTYYKKVIEILKRQLSATDYQAIKFAEGMMTEEEYAPIRTQRQAWRDEINMLEQEQIERR
jgi:hypothetical protein